MGYVSLNIQHDLLLVFLMRYNMHLKGSMTHLKALPIYMKFLLQVAPDIRRIL